MKRLIFILTALTLTACASKPKAEGFVLPVALSETFRGGSLKGLEHADSAELGMPNQYDRVEHTCTSMPVYDIYGRYTRTDVRCW